MSIKTNDNGRRQFLKTGLVAARSFFIVPRHVLGKGFISPSDKLNLASIGAGGKGWSDLLTLIIMVQKILLLYAM